MEETLTLKERSAIIQEEDKKRFLFKNRMIEQDIAKGLMIFAVVFIHCVPLTKLVDTILRAILGMVIPFFFFISGFNYKKPSQAPTNRKEWFTLYGKRVRKRLRQILVPLLFCSTILLGISFVIVAITKNPEVPVTYLDMLKSFGGFWISEPLSSKVLNWPTIGTYIGNERLFEPNWFILHMVLAYVVFYAVVDWALSNKKRYASVLFALVTASCLLNWLCFKFSFKLPWGLENAAAYASIMLMGCGVKKKNLFSEERYTKKYWPWINCVCCFAICIALGFLWPRAGQISGSGQICKVFYEICPEFAIIEIPFTLVYSVISSYFLIWFCKLLAKVRAIKFYFSYLGRNSLMILVFHLVFVGVAKMIMGVKMNASMGFVDYVDWRDLVAFVLALVMVTIFITINVLCKGQFRKAKRIRKMTKIKYKELSEDNLLSEEAKKQEIAKYKLELKKTLNPRDC